MAIKINDSPEPLSEASLVKRGPSSTPLLVESSASRVLRQELERYCKGLINGRSFLIAGHRGAGKTTLVAKAFMDVRQASGSSMLRPLFIPLHGPSLFPDPAAQAVAAKQETAAILAAQAAKPPEPGRPDAKPAIPPRKSDAQIALEQITLGLHRAVAREFATQYRQRADSLAQLRRTPNGSREWLQNARAGRELTGDQVQNDDLPDVAALEALISRLPADRELFELAGQLEAELYEGPTPERLRDFWERAHALSGGVLFAGGFAPLMSGIVGNPTASLPPGMFPNLVAVHGQGVRELVALSGIVEAYRRISGDYKRSEGEKSLRSQTSEVTTGFEATKELAAPIASLITGGLAGTGLAISGATPATTALGGIITALGAAFVFKATSTRKRERSASREYQFIHDLSVATLDRILPILIDRLRNAGLAPVFVVDELDKVKELSTRLVGMVHHLKKLVAENAFFCFLTNRSYFEEMLAKGSGRPYPVEYTYYTERLFVVFSPEDFERYLRTRIPDPVVEQSDTPMTTAPAGPGSVEGAACAYLRWTLRHRAQLHVVDLHREIAALRDDDGLVRTKPEVITSARRNRIDLTFQVGIELTLAQDEVEQVLMDRPEFRRLVHDAMYFISRQWLSGVEEIDLTSTGLATFMTYLENRTGREEEWPDGKPPAEKPRESVSLKDADFLFDHVGVLADFLSDRPTLDLSGRDWRRERLDAWSEARKKRDLPPIEGDVHDGLLTGEQASLLQRQEPAGVYRFRYRVAGKSRQPAPRPEAAPTPGAAQPQVPTAPEEAPSREPQTTAPSSTESPKTRGAEPIEAPAPVSSSPPAWKEQAEFIEEFAEALFFVTGGKASSTTTKRAAATQRESVVSLEALGTRFRILAPSPTASVAHKAIANLRDAEARGASQPPNEEDTFQVDQFYRILQRNGRQIARAIVLGAIVGRKRDDGTEERIAAGLRVISRALQFANKREGEVATALENVSAMVTKLYKVDVESSLSAIPTTLSSVKPFADVTRPMVFDAFAIAADDMALIESGAWDDAQNRIVHWLRMSEMLDPTLQEILAAAGGVGPTRLLEFDITQMTLHQWTRVLLEARQTVPWLTLVCWHALGFRANNVNELRSFVRWAALPDYFTSSGASLTGWNNDLVRAHAAVHEGILLYGGSANSTLVLLRRGNSPMTASWRPRADGATLIVTAKELQAIITPLSAPSVAFELPSTPESVCAVEMDPEIPLELSTVQLPAIKYLLRGSARLINVYPPDYAREMRPPLIAAPTDASAVMKAAQLSSQTMP